MKLHVYWCSDEQYFYPTCVSIFSFLRHKREQDEVFVTILSYVPLGDVGKDYLARAISRMPGVAVSYHVLGEETAGRLAVTGSSTTRLTASIYARLLIPQIAREERVLYLDSDTIVCRDLSPLFELDMEGMDMGAVEIPYFRGDPFWDSLNSYGFPVDKYDYFNSGVLLMDVPLLRNNRLFEHAADLAMGRRLTCDDQDALNIAARGRFFHLPQQYNFYYENYSKSLVHPDVRRRMELMTREKRYSIVHYPGSDKPWNAVIHALDFLWRDCERAFRELGGEGSFS